MNINERMKELAGITESKETEKFAKQILKHLPSGYETLEGAHTGITTKTGDRGALKLTYVGGEMRLFMGLKEIYKGSDAKKAAEVVRKVLK